jgi:UDP-glucose 4-epimerase
MKKVFITGGSGFIGSHLTDRLLSRGDQVLVLDNYATGRKENLTAQAGLEVVEGSVADATLVADLMKRFRPEVVVHAAASYKDPENWAEDARTNALGTVHVVQASREVGVKRLVYFQTSLCYGLHPRENPITVDHPNFPGATSYALSKTCGEDYVRLSGLDYVSLRLANTFGPRNISGPLAIFYQRLTNGQPCFVVDSRRDLLFIEDLMRLVLPVVDGQGKGIYHAATGRDYSIKELYDAVVAALGLELKQEVEVRPRGKDDAATLLLDTSRTYQDFGWKAETNLSQGVRKAVAYYQEFGVTNTFTHLRTPAESARS